MNTSRNDESEVLLHLGFLPERLRHTIAWLFSDPARGSSYLIQLSDEHFELMPKYVPALEQVAMLEALFEKLYPGYDIENGEPAGDVDWVFHDGYVVEHVCTHFYG